MVFVGELDIEVGKKREKLRVVFVFVVVCWFVEGIRLKFSGF